MRHLLSKFVERYKHNRRFEFNYLKTLLINRYSASEKKAVESYKNRHKGQTGVIVASGPSLNNIDFEKLKRFPTIGMNRIYLLYERTDFRPNYYCLQDHLVAEDNSEEINSLDDSVMFIPKDLSYCIKGNKNILYTNFIRRYIGKNITPKFGEDYVSRYYCGGTVTYDALQLAFFLGFKRVYIVGLDHNYKIPDYATGEKIVSRENDINHFDPRYFGRGKRWHDPFVERMELAYKIAKEVYAKAGREIINATPTSKLSEEVFSKIKFEDIPELLNLMGDVTENS